MVAKSHSRFAAALLAGLGLVGAACGGREHRALELLRRANDRAGAVRSVKYSVRYEGLGSTAAETPTVEGDVWMSGWSGDGPERLRCEARFKLPWSAEATRVTLGRYEGEYYVIDHQAKKVLSGRTVESIGTFQPVLRSIMMSELVHPAPFAEELEATVAASGAGRRLAGEDCDEIRVVYANGREAVWFFAKSDSLPRAVERHDVGNDIAARQTVSALVVDPPLEGEAFRLQIPSGYSVGAP